MSTENEIEFGTNNGDIKISHLTDLGATLLEDPEKKARGEPPQGFRLRSGAVLHGIVPPTPFDNALTDRLTFAQSANLVAVRYEAELAKIEGNSRLSREGKDADSTLVHQQAAAGVARARQQVEVAAAEADRALAEFYAPPTLAANDHVSAMQDAEARQYLRGLSAREIGKLVDAMQTSDDPRIERVLLGVVRSPLPIASIAEQTVEALWRALRERCDPIELGKRQARANLATWARMVADTALNYVGSRIQIAARDTTQRHAMLGRGLRLSVFNALDNDDLRFSLPTFGFTPPVAGEFRRLAKAA